MSKNAADSPSFGLGTIDSAKEYYSFTLTADEQGRVVQTVYSHWTGWADGEPRRELRAASLVKPEAMARTWTQLRMPYLIVNTEEQFASYFGWLGGHALVSRELAERFCPEILGASECVKEAPLGGFVDVDTLPHDAMRRVPTPKLRMSIFKRDQYRCKVCGRRPEDHVDLELHVHHIRQWAHGGLTQDWNLITLCSTCHRGLDPHEEPRLWTFIDQPLVASVDDHRRKHLSGLDRFRQVRTREVREWQRKNKTPSRTKVRKK